MDSTWPEVKKLFSAALELDQNERASFVDDACPADEAVRAEVFALLAAHEAATDFIDSPAMIDIGLMSADDLNNESAVAGKRIGPYEIVRELGHGGMGTVYLAVRADDQYRKQVAIKVVNRGMDTDLILRRFTMERQILANLEHPNIARLLEGGSTDDGLPYFVMEYIEGQPINRYCDAQLLSTSERLELFRQVCSALQYAHQNLVVHRDIKPSNILVTAEGVPKLLDFGIAKLLSPGWDAETGEATASVVQLMTPEYASPEQLRGLTITTASDVYSLGLVLYELLSGRHPFRLASRQAEEVARVVLQSEPARPSDAISDFGFRSAESPDKPNVTSKESPGPETNRQSAILNPKSLRGDIDNIVLKALRKEPNRRYASVQEFSEDIRRHLEGLPVLASPDTFSYRAGKFVQRNRVAVLAAAVVVITLLSATAITTWQARVARRERDKAQMRFVQVRQLANTVLFEYHDAIAQLPGSTPIRQKMVRDALNYLDNLSAESSGDPSLQAELATAYEKVGDVQGNPYGANLGNQDGALASYRKALGIREGLYGANRSDDKAKFELGLGYKRVADILWGKGENEEALLNYRKALAPLEDLTRANPTNQEYLRSANFALNGVAHVQAQSGDYKGALESYRKCLANAETLESGDSSPVNVRNVAIANLKLGDAFSDLRDFDAAAAAYEKSVARLLGLAAAVKNNAAATRELGLAYARLASAYTHQKRYDKAVEFHLKAIEEQRKVSAADPDNVQSLFDIAATYSNLADSYLQMKKLDSAATSVREALRIISSALSRNPGYFQGQANLVVGYQTYGEILLAQGDLNMARENFRKALGLFESEQVRKAETSLMAEVYEGMGEADSLEVKQTKSGLRQTQLFKDACDWYQKSLDVWQGLDQQGGVTGDDRETMAEVRQKIEQCKAAPSK